MSMVGVLSNHLLVCVGGTANKSSSLFTPSHDCPCTNAILGEYVWSLSFGGTGPTTGCSSFYTFARRWGCSEKTTHQRSSSCCSSLFCCLLDILTSHDVAGYLRTGCSARFPSASAPRLIRGATDRRRPLNKLPKQCPLWTRAPVKYGSAPPTCLV